jgi:hypothetical protein
MTEPLSSKDQQHPLYGRDRPLIDILLAQGATDYNLSELARLKIRYQGFPGARDIQNDLDQVLQSWGLTEAEPANSMTSAEFTKVVAKRKSRIGISQ